MDNEGLLENTMFILYTAGHEPVAYVRDFLFTCEDEIIDKEEN